MGGLCSQVAGLAHWFLVIALVFAVTETAASVWVKLHPRTPDGEGRRTVAGPMLGPIVEGLAKVLAALKDLPAWVAILLAGLALVWTATSAPGLCA